MGHPLTFPLRIISGGQTGADLAALDAAIELGIPHGGYLPRGRRTERGPLPRRYRLQELDRPDYRSRTEKNVLAADGTLIVSHGPLTGGSALTEALAIRHGRPLLWLDLDAMDEEQAAAALERWLREHRVRVLNVAGPRASHDERIYEAVRRLLMAVDWQSLAEEAQRWK